MIAAGQEPFSCPAVVIVALGLIAIGGQSSRVQGKIALCRTGWMISPRPVHVPFIEMTAFYGRPICPAHHRAG